MEELSYKTNFLKGRALINIRNKEQIVLCRQEIEIQRLKLNYNELLIFFNNN